MRDPKRIPGILHDIRQIWERNPDLRLGQLIGNLQGRSQSDVYYLEDDKLVEKLDQLYEEKPYDLAKARWLVTDTLQDYFSMKNLALQILDAYEKERVLNKESLLKKFWFAKGE